MMVVAQEPARTARRPPAAGQPLNAADRLMLVAHDGMRSIGHPGFVCQSHLWLGGRADEDRLRAAVGRLSARFPVVTARLEYDDRRRDAVWRFRSGALPPLDVVETAGDDSAVARFAESLFAEPMDLTRCDPIEFHLLRLPDAGDVFILRWNHALMDGKAPELVLKELNRLGDATDAGDNAAPTDGDIGGYLRRHGRLRRVRAALRVVGGQIGWPAVPVTIIPPDAVDWVCGPIRLAVRSLDAESTQAISRRAKRLCGFENVTPLVVASVFRVVSRMSPRRQRPRTVFQTDVPLNLRPPGADGPIFRNYMSFISMRARRDELDDRNALAAALNRRMRDQLLRGIDLGNVQMMSIMSRKGAALEKHIRRRMKHHPFTLGFGYLGPLVAGLETFCGAPIERYYTLNSALSPPGITLQVNHCRGRMNLALTYIEDVVSEPTAAEFLDRLTEDLRHD